MSLPTAIPPAESVVTRQVPPPAPAPGPRSPHYIKLDFCLCTTTDISDRLHVQPSLYLSLPAQTLKPGADNETNKADVESTGSTAIISKTEQSLAQLRKELEREKQDLATKRSVEDIAARSAKGTEISKVELNPPN